MADPVQYLHLVRDTLSHKDYLQFCKIMAEYKSNRICTQETVKEALRIFGNNLELKKGFQIFLPENYSLEKNFLENVKEKTRNNPLLYNQFLLILHSRLLGSNIEEIHAQLLELFKDYPDLMEDVVNLNDLEFLESHSKDLQDQTLEIEDEEVVDEQTRLLGPGLDLNVDLESGQGQIRKKFVYFLVCTSVWMVMMTFVIYYGFLIGYKKF